MSWQGRIPGSCRARVILVHQQAWQLIETRAPVNALDYQAENDRLGYILAELWLAETPETDLVALAITQFNAAEPREKRKPSKRTETEEAINGERAQDSKGAK